MAQPHRKTSRVDGRPAGRRGISAMLRLASRGLKHHRTPRAGELGKAIRTTSVANRRRNRGHASTGPARGHDPRFYFLVLCRASPKSRRCAGPLAPNFSEPGARRRDSNSGSFFPTTVWWGSSRSGPVEARLVRCHAAVGCEEDCCRVIFG
jgi:hypothetical protein